MVNNRLSHLVDAPNRHEVGLRVKPKPLVDAAIEMNRKLWDTCDRIGSHEGGLASIVDNSSGETQVAIEPRVVENPSVDLNGELVPSVVLNVRVRFEFETW